MRQSGRPIDALHRKAGRPERQWIFQDTPMSKKSGTLHSLVLHLSFVYLGSRSRGEAILTGRSRGQLNVGFRFNA
jgi:hypothetical protein